MSPWRTTCGMAFIPSRPPKEAFVLMFLAFLLDFHTWSGHIQCEGRISSELLHLLHALRDKVRTWMAGSCPDVVDGFLARRRCMLYRLLDTTALTMILAWCVPGSLVGAALIHTLCVGVVCLNNARRIQTLVPTGGLSLDPKAMIDWGHKFVAFLAENPTERQGSAKGIAGINKAGLSLTSSRRNVRPL